jgi:hypothetical protein
MGRIRSSLSECDNQFRESRSARSELRDSPNYRNGLKRTSSLRDSWKRKLLAMPKVLREKARQSSLKRSPLKRASKGLKAEQAKYWKLSAAFLGRPENKFCNKRNNLLITAMGETMCCVEWSERTGLPGSVISRRIARGWDSTVAVTKPRCALSDPRGQWNACPDDGRK